MPMRAGSTSGCCPSTSRQRRRSQRFWVSGLHPAMAAWTRFVSQRVVVLGVPVEPLAEAAKVGRQHHVAAPDQLQGVVGVGHVGVLEPDHLGLARAVTVAGQDGRRRAGLAAVGHQQVGRDRHRALGVEDDLLPAVAVALHRLEGLDVERDRLGHGPEQLGQPAPAAVHARPRSRRGRPGGGGPRGRWPSARSSTGTRASSCGRGGVRTRPPVSSCSLYGSFPAGVGGRGWANVGERGDTGAIESPHRRSGRLAR